MTTMGRPVLITGSSGLIGSAVAEYFSSHGHSVVGIDNNMREVFFGQQGSTRLTQARLQDQLQNFEHKELDIRDREAVDQLFLDLKPVAIVHTAAQPSHDRAAAILPDALPATEKDWSAEYLGPTISIAIVASLQAAAEHINRYGSHHTDAIVTSKIRNADQFTTLVDSSAVMVNASTRFNDGGVFGLGAEIGISTDKFHARGPCGVKELTTYKYIVRGEGHIRK